LKLGAKSEIENMCVAFWCLTAQMTSIFDILARICASLAPWQATLPEPTADLSTPLELLESICEGASPPLIALVLRLWDWPFPSIRRLYR